MRFVSVSRSSRLVSFLVHRRRREREAAPDIPGGRAAARSGMKTVAAAIRETTGAATIGSPVSPIQL